MRRHLLPKPGNQVTESSDLASGRLLADILGTETTAFKFWAASVEAVVPWHPYIDNGHEMPTVTTLKSSRTREKKALVREKTEAETLLQTEWTDSPQEMLKLSLSTGKVLLSLETKLARLETASDKLAEALEQEENTEALEQFQTTLCGR